MRNSVFLTLPLVALLTGCVGDGDTEVKTAAVSSETPNSFLTYPNMQASLSAGIYTLEIGPATGTAAGSYSLVITWDDGSTRTYSGSWPEAGTDVLPTDIILASAGGLKIEADSSVDVRLVLKRVQFRDLLSSDEVQVVATGENTIDLPLTPISSADYATAYYAAVDPDNDRDTLEKWKLKNGFYDPANTVTHVIFRDALDLGYGRDMYVLKNTTTGRIAFFVNNFIVQQQPGSSSNYGPLNVDAAISQDRRFLKGTNAIEFSPANEDNPDDPNGEMKITKFFTFDKDGNRLTSADLDGRGVKHMPGMCWACHGGQTMPLDAEGKFQPYSLRSAKLNILGVSEFEYSLQNGYHRDQMEEKFRVINSYVRDHYVEMDARDIAANTGRGKWSAEYALKLVNGRYNNTIDTTGTLYNDDFVPEGWSYEANPGAGVDTETLFKRVVGPHCTACHSLQGRAATHEPDLLTDHPGNIRNAINFSSYKKFMAYRSRIIDYVYKRGIMPMSLRNFEAFWESPDGAPSILAAALGDPSLFVNGKVIQPGNPIARPGASRVVRSPVQLDGSASSFASNYLWTIQEPAVVDGATVYFDSPASAQPKFYAPAGTYKLRLTVSSSKGSHYADVYYTVSGAAEDQTALTFVDDIRPILISQTCTTCHRNPADGGTRGVPVYWINGANELGGLDEDGNTLYERIMARVDRKDPENSRLLQRPTNDMHGGDKLLDLNNPTDLADYNTIVNWIREGAVCGTNPGENLGCPE